MRSLEQANLVHGIARRPRLRHELTEDAPFGRAAQLLDEFPRARQRHTLLQLVSGNRDRRRHTIESSQLGEKARLPGSGIANDDSNRGKTIATHEPALIAQRGDLGGPANKLPGHQRQRYDGSTIANRPLRRSPAMTRSSADVSSTHSPEPLRWHGDTNRSMTHRPR